jgi:hypothetical protein
MFCHVTHALQGVVLRSIDIAKRFIARTATATGLRVVAELAKHQYEKGLKASDEFLETMSIRFHRLLPALNYTLTP